VSRRKRPRGHTNHERWLVSYADFITLLFAFFVVLYASAQVDQRKIGRLAVAIQVAFQELGVFSSSGSPVPAPASQPTPQEIEAARRTVELARLPPPAQSLPASNDEADLSALQNELQQALAHEIAEHAVALHREVDGLVISLREFAFFDSASDALKPSALPALDRIASILAARQCRVRVEGHTDNIPVHTAQWASNWELSTARSTGIVRLLIQRNGFTPDRLSAAGYAQYHPIASNETAQGRAQNRRVDLVVVSQHISVVNPASSSKPSPALP